MTTKYTYMDDAGGYAIHGQLNTSQLGLSGNDHAYQYISSLY